MLMPLVWAGLADAHYQYTSSAVRLSRNEMGEQSDPIASLFHGRLDNITIDGQYKVLEVPHNLLFFLVPTENPQSPFLCMQMEVNGWRMRLNDAELGEAAAPWSRK